MKTPIHDFLLEHAKKNPISFHMPGHKGAGLYKRLGFEQFLSDFPDYDITEIPGADNLFQAEGIIKEVQDRYARLYGVKRSYLLINGTSGGIIASILACVPKGRKLVMARNCHKSVFNALVLADIDPIYAYPETIPEFGISGEISAGCIERLLTENKDAEAVILPSPNYYGICSDIAAIADIVHRHGKILIVDQAHGAHLPFFSKFEGTNAPRPSTAMPSTFMPASAEESGADIVINSTHKTLASLTQSAVLNLCSDKVDPYMLEDKLQCIESTSPSYILMASLDLNGQILETHGAELIKSWSDDLDYFYSESLTIPGLKAISGIKGLDRTKINLDMSGCGIDGAGLETLLLKEDIYIELTTGNIAMCMTGIGNRRADYERLLSALRRISDTCREPGFCPSSCAAADLKLPLPPTLVAIPRTKRKIRLAEAAGLICAASIIPYPPGIPLVCPGERLEEDAVAYIRALRARGDKVIGVSESGEILVGCASD